MDTTEVKTPATDAQKDVERWEEETLKPVIDQRPERKKTFEGVSLEAVERLNVDIQGSDETPERFQIRFSKPISAFSWGEVGTVNVIRRDEQQTRIYVNSEKRDRIQVTGTSERQFAEQIFANITESLARLQP